MSERASVRRSRHALVLLLLAALLLAGSVLALLVGPANEPVGQVVRVLGHGLKLLLSGQPLPQTGPYAIVFQLRLPRLFLACIVGACLALSGGIMQALFQNPMADPYILGISSGAALGAVAALVLGVGVTLVGIAAVPLLTFAGALAVTTLVYLLSHRGGRVQTATLLLTGIAVGSLVSAITSFLMMVRQEDLQVVIAWLLGSLAGRSWLHVGITLPQLVLGGAVALAMARPLNVLLLGDEVASNLGISVQPTKRLLLAVASLLAAAAVAVSGIIGFVGLLIPHLARLVVGPDHRLLLPASALAGATLLVWADVAARAILSPTELPIGIITALLGCPFFLYLLRRKGTKGV